MRRALGLAAWVVIACGTTGLPLGGTAGGTTGGGSSGGGTTGGSGGACATVNAQCGSTLLPACCAGLDCVFNDNDAQCVVPNGGGCTDDFNCESESCDAGSCQCQTLGNVALAGTACCSPLTLPNGTGAGNCCGGAGYACHLASDCCNSLCQSGQCL